MTRRLLVSFVTRIAREFGLYVVLFIAVISLFTLAFNLNNNVIYTLLAGGVVFVCMVVLFLVARSKQVQPPPLPEVKTTLLTPTILVNEVRTAALVTYAQIGTVTIKKERAKADWRVFDRFFGEDLVMDIGVRVVAGVNLKHLRDEDVRLDGQHVEITLPPTKVLMVFVDESLTRVVSHHNGLFTGNDVTLMDAARREAMEGMVNAAIDKDLFEKAGQQASIVVAAIARGLGFEDIQVIPTMPAIGQHFEELHDPSSIAKIIALPLDSTARADQMADE
jgi:hypothetical protein